MPSLNPPTRELWLSCECRNPNHSIRLNYEPPYTYHSEEDNLVHWELPEDIVLDVHLYQYRSFWKRAWEGIKYIFGKEAQYGHFDCVLLSSRSCQKVVEFIFDFEEDHSGRALPLPSKGP